MIMDDESIGAETETTFDDDSIGAEPEPIDDDESIGAETEPEPVMEATKSIGRTDASMPATKCNGCAGSCVRSLARCECADHRHRDDTSRDLVTNGRPLSAASIRRSESTGVHHPGSCSGPGFPAPSSDTPPHGARPLLPRSSDATNHQDPYDPTDPADPGDADHVWDFFITPANATAGDERFRIFDVHDRLVAEGPLD